MNNLGVFIYNIVLDTTHTPDEKQLYGILERSAPEYELRRLLGAFKVPYVTYLINKICDKRYVCVCADTDTARALFMHSMIGSACALGENSDIDEQNINRFNKGDVEHLFITPQTYIPELKDVDAVVFAQPSVDDIATLNSILPAMQESEHPKVYFFMHHDTIDCALKNDVWDISPTTTEVEFPYNRLTKERTWTATSFTQEKACSSVPS
jgi:hypothetical protein